MSEHISKYTSNINRYGIDYVISTDANNLIPPMNISTLTHTAQLVTTFHIFPEKAVAEACAGSLLGRYTQTVVIKLQVDPLNQVKGVMNWVSVYSPPSLQPFEEECPHYNFCGSATQASIPHKAPKFTCIDGKCKAISYLKSFNSLLASLSHLIENYSIHSQFFSIHLFVFSLSLSLNKLCCHYVQ